MLGLPADGLYVFVAVAVLSTTLAGTVVQLGSAVPTGAEEAAATIDAVAADTTPAVGVYPTTAETVTIAPTSVTTTVGGYEQQAPLTHGPVVPVPPDTALAAVLAGTPPQQVFTSPAAFAEAVNETAETAQTYNDIGQIRVRTLQWGEHDVTLVGR